MKKYLIKKYLFTTLLVLCSIIAIQYIGLQFPSKEHYSTYKEFYFLIAICWLYPLYHLSSTLISWLLFKKDIKHSKNKYTPKPADKNTRKNYFNIKISSNLQTIDFSDEGNIKATFYKSKSTIKRWTKPSKEINYPAVKMLVARYQSFTDIFTLSGEETFQQIYLVKYYLLTTNNKLIYLFTMDCSFDYGKSKFEENSLHSKKGFQNIFSRYSEQIADFIEFPLITYK